VTARRRAVLAAAALGVVAAGVAAAQTPLYFVFSPGRATAGAIVEVRLGGTPAGFTATERQEPVQRPIRLYLVPRAVGGAVGSRLDRRLHFVGEIVPDRNSHGVLRFRVPPLDTGRYALAYSCPDCARHSGGVSFGVQAGQRPRRGLDIRLPDPTRSCPVTRGRYSNGWLSVNVQGGVISRRPEADGSVSTKLGWLPRKGFTGVLTVRGERLDAPDELEVLSVNRGSSSAGRGGWASAVRFPSEGCWRISGRVRDISLSYIVKVVASS
jgi:hypothetical protein